MKLVVMIGCDDYTNAEWLAPFCYPVQDYLALAAKMSLQCASPQNVATSSTSSARTSQRVALLRPSLVPRQAISLQAKPIGPHPPTHT